jgi:translocator assembly and maintenance protein 41
MPNHSTVDEMKDYKKLMASFPSGISLAFAYGSGAFHQQGHARKEDNMLDLVFAVENSYDWHEKNMKMNPTHYSALRFLGPGVVSHVQGVYGAGVYYNSMVKHHGRLLKYGVISVDQLIDDLNHWRFLYISGRLHKPVRILTMSNDQQLALALQANLRHAVATALLCLPDTFSELELYLQVARISYLGDFRMTFGEDRNKVNNIVSSNVGSFRDLYSHVLDSLALERCESTDARECVVYHIGNVSKRYDLITTLPSHLKQKIKKSLKTEAELKPSMMEETDISSVIQVAVSSIVNESSWSQSLKGILTAGILKSIRYSAAKVIKMWKSLATSH